MSGETSLDAIFSGAAVEADPVEVDPPQDLPQDQPQEQTGVDESVTPTDEPQEDPNERHKKGIEAGITAERSKRQAVERERDELRARLEQFEKQRPAQHQHLPTQGEPIRPKRADFESEEEYEDALLDYGDQRRELRNQREQAEKHARDEADRQQKAARDEAERQQKAANEVVMKGIQAFPDFNEVIDGGLGHILSQPTEKAFLFRQALIANKRAHEVSYYLGNNPEEANRIFALDPLQMVEEIAEIRLTKLESIAMASEPAQPKPVIPKTLTQARDARGQFKPTTYDGPTPLDDVLATKR